MPNNQNCRSWPLIERISPRAAALLREADGLENIVIDFADIFDENGPKLIKESFHPNENKTSER